MGDNAKREWREETNMSADDISWLSPEEALVDSWTTEYFVGCWRGGVLEHALDEGGQLQQNRGLGEKVWAVKDDPTGPDPIIRSYWLAVHAAMVDANLSNPRRMLLRDAHAQHVQFNRAMTAQEAAPGTASKSLRWGKR